MPSFAPTRAGETLCDEKNPVILEKMDFPDPVIKIAIEPKSKADLEKMGVGLNKLAQEDPSFNYSRDEETNQVRIPLLLCADLCCSTCPNDFRVRPAARCMATRLCRSTHIQGKNETPP